jgi:hypothetical protein
LRAGIEKIIIYLTSSEVHHKDDESLSYFLWTYIRPYVGTVQFFAVIEGLFRKKHILGHSLRLFADRLSDRLFVVWFMKHEFQKTSADLEVMQGFIDLHKGHLSHHWNERLSSSLDIADQANLAKRLSTSKAELQVAPVVTVKLESLFLLTFDNPSGRLEVAQQITLLCEQAWREYTPGDLFRFWLLFGDLQTKKSPARLCDDIASGLSLWVSKSIYSATSLESTVSVTTFWLELAKVSLMFVNAHQELT